MSFEDILDRHSDHTVVILWRLHKNKLDPIPGLYCQDCSKLIKWLSLTETDDLVKLGVETLDMIPAERAIWKRNLELAEQNKSFNK